MPKVLLRAVCVVAFLYGSWIAMEAIHEMGHILNALLSGGRVTAVSLPPLGFSRTELSINPHPVFVTWGGPCWGSVIPFVAWLALSKTAARRTRAFPAFQFFAGFCLIANGVYLGAGWIDGVGDAGDLLRRGTPLGALLAFGVVAAGGGLYLWHRLPQVSTKRSNPASHQQ